MMRLVTCLLLCNLLAILCYAQKPVITPKQNPILQLNPQGKHIITSADLIDNIAVVTDSSIVVQFKPPVLDCSTLGSQTVKARALTNGVSSIGNYYTVGFNKNLLGLTYDPLGNLYVIENSGFGVRKITPEGKVTVFAGTGVRGDKDGPAENCAVWRNLRNMFRLQGKLVCNRCQNKPH